MVFHTCDYLYVTVLTAFKIRYKLLVLSIKGLSGILVQALEFFVFEQLLRIKEISSFNLINESILNSLKLFVISCNPTYLFYPQSNRINMAMLNFAETNISQSGSGELS